MLVVIKQFALNELIRFKPGHTDMKRKMKLANTNLIILIVCFFFFNDLIYSLVKDSTSDGIVIEVGKMNVERAAHSSILLPNGLVLITGGIMTGEQATESAELFNPGTRSFITTGSMSVPRQTHTATLLTNGKVLIAGGGSNGQCLSSAELFDPVSGEFTPTGSLLTARYSHRAVLLNNGKVLIIGGIGDNWTYLSSAELYDPQTGKFSLTAEMNTARDAHTATLLHNGNVLITGGSDGRGVNKIIHSSAELYLTSAGIFTSAGSMNFPRQKHDATLLSDGRVFISGGRNENETYFSTEIYDPTTGIFIQKANMNASRYKHRNTSFLLNNSNVLLIGSAEITEVYDPVENDFRILQNGIGVVRLFGAGTALPYGTILFTGGYDYSIKVSSQAWLYIPNTTNQGDKTMIPHLIKLSQNYPNPFNSSTTIHFQIPELSIVSIYIYNALGEKVETLLNKEKLLGKHKIKFNGNGLPSGVYYYSLTTRNFIESKKMILLR